MAYGKYKDLTKRAQSDKVFRDKAFEIASNLKYDGYQREAISKNVYFDVLDDIFNNCINTYHRTIKMKPLDVTFNSYAEYNQESNEKNPKFKIGDHLRISK